MKVDNPFCTRCSWLFKNVMLGSGVLVSLRSSVEKLQGQNSFYSTHIRTWQSPKVQNPTPILLLWRVLQCLGLRLGQGRLLQPLELNQYPRVLGPQGLYCWFSFFWVPPKIESNMRFRASGSSVQLQLEL